MVDARGRDVIEPVDGVARRGLLWITLGSHDDGEGRAATRLDVVRHRAARGSQKKPVEAAVDQRNEHASLWVAKPNVELEDARFPLVDHEPDEEHAAERRSLRTHATERRRDHVLLDCATDGLRDDRRGRVGAHPSGVGSAIPVRDTLVVLGCREREPPLAVRDDVEARFLPRQDLFDDDAFARVAERSVAHRRVDGLQRSVFLGRQQLPCRPRDRRSSRPRADLRSARSARLR